MGLGRRQGYYPDLGLGRKSKGIASKSNLGFCTVADIVGSYQGLLMLENFAPSTISDYRSGARVGENRVSDWDALSEGIEQ